MQATFQQWFQRISLFLLIFMTVPSCYAKTASEIYELASKSTVVIINIDVEGKQQSLGSGVLISANSVVTNCHVVKNANKIKVRSGKVEYEAILKYSDWERDVCSLTVGNMGAKSVKIGNTKSLQVGSKVYAIGAPRGLELTLSDGIVSSIREVEGGRYIQTTAPISPGSSGGGLFDQNGALVGLTTFYFSDGQNLNFAVPVEWINELPQHSTSEPRVVQTELQWLSRARLLLQKKNWTVLIEHCEKWTRATPHNTLAWSNLGAAFLMSGQVPQAIEAYEHAFVIKPNDPVSLTSLGQAYSLAGRHVEAIELYKHSLHILPDDVDAWVSLGDSYSSIGQFDKSLEALQKALIIKPEGEQVWLHLGQSYFKANLYTKSIESIQHALIINPELEEAWFNLAQGYLAEKQMDKSIDALKHALQINPTNGGTWFALGAFYSHMGERDKVLEVYEKLMPLDAKLAEQLLANKF